MDFGIAQCSVLIVKRRKRDDIERIKLPTRDIITDPDETGYNYMGGLELDGILHEEMKEVITGTYMKKTWAFTRV